MYPTAPWSLGLLRLLLTAAPLPTQNLKDTQKAIRERILTEAGSDNLIYSRVDFSDCAVMIQARTPRGAGGEEVRTTHTLHATSLDPNVADPGDGGTVRLVAASGQPSLRRVTQRIKKGVVREAVSLDRGWS